MEGLAHVTLLKWSSIDFSYRDHAAKIICNEKPI